jgi:DNA-binding PadR family transcriptional regulator
MIFWVRLVFWFSKRFLRRVPSMVMELFSMSRERPTSYYKVEEGSLYPALHRMEQSGWIRSEWALTETNRTAKYYKLTAGRKELQEVEMSFEQLVKGVRTMLRYA